MEYRQSSVLRISDENTMKLINLYEKEECLWNVKSSGYKNRFERDLAAKRIAQKLNIKHFTARYVVLKFRNLRNSYCQELKKALNSAKAGDNPPYRPKVFWYRKMDSFLRPHLHPQLLTADPEMPKPKVEVKSEPVENNEPAKLSNPEDEDEPDCDSGSEGSDGLLRERSRNSSTSKIHEDTQDELMRMMKDVSSHLHLLTNQKMDSFDSFGKYVTALLRNMPVQRALEVQPRIVELLVSSTTKSEPNHAASGLPGPPS